MKVFATLTTVLGASTATQHFQNQLHASNNMRLDQHSMKPTMGMSMESQMSQRGMSDRPLNNQMSNMSNMYRNNGRNMMGQEMGRNMMGQQMGQNINGQEMGHNIMGQEMRSGMRDMPRQNQAFGPNQYFVKDDFGNYVYGYNDQQSEKSEQNNGKFTKGHYTYVMSNGVKRQVDYIADDNGFHIIRDNADPARIKRSSEPDFVQTKMTSVMDSSSLRDDTSDRMTNMMGRNMPSQMDRNMLGMDQQRYSNMMMDRNMMGQDSVDRQMMGQDSMGRQMMGQNTMGRNMLGRNIYNIMSNRGMTSHMSNTMGQQMDSNLMGRDMNMDVMGRNMMGQDRSTQMMGRNMLAQQDMTPNMIYSNMMGQDMMDTRMMQRMEDVTNYNQMSGNMMDSRGMSSDMINSPSNNGLIGQHMMQKMEIKRVPETYTSTRLF